MVRQNDMPRFMLQIYENINLYTYHNHTDESDEDESRPRRRRRLAERAAEDEAYDKEEVRN